MVEVKNPSVAAFTAVSTCAAPNSKCCYRVTNCTDSNMTSPIRIEAEDQKRIFISSVKLFLKNLALLVTQSDQRLRQLRGIYWKKVRVRCAISFIRAVIPRNSLAASPRLLPSFFAASLLLAWCHCGE
ncbi:uncharacterized protein PHALS_02107 [Plasmopara halstedii]|uniref:Uncharacterized protein n=1 Tax=Plasmopara halstedii TaxID=4781 RepID=A0A0P1AXM6_PLAHL|nr:uncharacterized protein PHALS_02107 [Plasmopara halstedii]CEG45836.1 hypothetical protein PHALS_02107 [Plasmopara halstedii]|eukprot:XP_024582205.1 hypothetical protein PHALS_02107 [Plasmopara halstedii]